MAAFGYKITSLFGLNGQLINKSQLPLTIIFHFYNNTSNKKYIYIIYESNNNIIVMLSYNCYLKNIYIPY